MAGRKGLQRPGISCGREGLPATSKGNWPINRRFHLSSQKGVRLPPIIKLGLNCSKVISVGVLPSACLDSLELRSCRLASFTASSCASFAKPAANSGFFSPFLQAMKRQLVHVLFIQTHQRNPVFGRKLAWQKHIPRNLRILKTLRPPTQPCVHGACLSMRIPVYIYTVSIFLSSFSSTRYEACHTYGLLAFVMGALWPLIICRNLMSLNAEAGARLLLYQLARYFEGLGQPLCGLVRGAAVWRFCHLQ